MTSKGGRTRFFQLSTRSLPFSKTSSGNLVSLSRLFSIVERHRDIPSDHSNPIWMVLLVFVPFAVACPSMGFRWACRNTTPQFAILLPPLISDLVVGALGVILLNMQHQASSVRELFTRSYWKMVGVGFLRALLVAFLNAALSHLGALPLQVIMKSSIVPCLLMQALVSGACPADPLQLLTIVTSLMGILLFVSSSSGGGDAELSAVGLVMAVLAAVSNALGDVLTGLVSKSRLLAASNPGAERIRCIVVMEFSKAFFLFCMLLCFEGSLLVSRGVLYGWDLRVAIGAVLAPSVKVVLFNLSIMQNGPLTSNLVATFDMAVVFFFDVCVFQSLEIDSRVLVLGMVTTSILAFFVHVMILKRDEHDVLAQMAQDIEKSAEGHAEASLASRVHTSRGSDAEVQCMLPSAVGAHDTQGISDTTTHVDADPSPVSSSRDDARVYRV